MADQVATMLRHATALAEEGRFAAAAAAFQRAINEGGATAEAYESLAQCHLDR